MKNNNYSQWCEVDLKNLDHNVDEIKKIVGKTKVLAVVKSNAYGHGIEEISKRLEKNNKIDYFGINSVNEAIILRKEGIKKPILVMGYVDNQDIDKIPDLDAEVVVGDLNFAKKLDKLGKKIKIHIKVDTGVNRLGFILDDFEGVLDQLKKLNNLEIIGLMSHLAAVEEGYLNYTKKQVEKFKKAMEIFESKGFSGVKHIGATSAILAYSNAYFDMVRLGIGLYGLWPSEETKQISFVNGGINLRPLMSFKTRIGFIKNVKRGEKIGYGCSYEAKENMLIAILPIGYYEGLDRRHSNISEVLVNGLRAKIVGKVCMNMAMIDITKISEKVKVGDEVVIFGKSGDDEITPEEFVKRIDIILHELTTNIPEHVMRNYIR